MTPREAIEVAIIEALWTLTSANGYDMPRDVRSVDRRLRPFPDIPEQQRPNLAILSEENESHYLELGPAKETTLTVNVRVTDTLAIGEEPAAVMNTYAAAIRKCLTVNQFWGGLAEMTEIQGVAQHEFAEALLPNLVTTVLASVHYEHEDA